MPNLSKSAESLDEVYISEILKPLQQESASVEYVCQYKAVVEFKQRLHLLEKMYADIYTKLADLDTKIQNNLL